MLHTQNLGQRAEKKLRKYFLHHPTEGALFSIIVLPIGVLFAVAGCTTVLVFPIGFLFGWI